MRRKSAEPHGKGNVMIRSARQEAKALLSVEMQRKSVDAWCIGDDRQRAALQGQRPEKV